MNKYQVVEDYLDELIPNPKCELDYFNDYSLLIAVMLSAQTKDSRVNEVTKVLFSKYKSLEELKNADYNDIKEIVMPLGNYTKKAFNIIEIARRISDEFNGVVPTDREILETFPGIGRKTVHVFFVEYLNIPAMPVDTHVERVSKRLGLVKGNASVLEIEKELMKNIKRENLGKRHLQLVLFGRYYCTAKRPQCDNCKLSNICKYK